MKRNLTAERALRWHLWPPGSKPKSIIPPRSVVRLVKTHADWNTNLKVGDEFRIGYYTRQDGPHCVWLVNHTGEYFHTWSQNDLLDHFEVVALSDETDTYGTHRPALEPI